MRVTTSHSVKNCGLNCFYPFDSTEFVFISLVSRNRPANIRLRFRPIRPVFEYSASASVTAKFVKLLRTTDFGEKRF